MYEFDYLNWFNFLKKCFYTKKTQKAALGRAPTLRFPIYVGSQTNLVIADLRMNLHKHLNHNSATDRAIDRSFSQTCYVYITIITEKKNKGFDFHFAPSAILLGHSQNFTLQAFFVWNVHLQVNPNVLIHWLR